MPVKFGNCELLLLISSVDVRTNLNNLNRTDKVVLATNGFAADGNNFVKRVKQRLEVGL